MFTVFSNDQTGLVTSWYTNYSNYFISYRNEFAQQIALFRSALLTIITLAHTRHWNRSNHRNLLPNHTHYRIRMNLCLQGTLIWWKKWHLSYKVCFIPNNKRLEFFVWMEVYCFKFIKNDFMPHAIIYDMKFDYCAVIGREMRKWHILCVQLFIAA